MIAPLRLFWFLQAADVWTTYRFLAVGVGEGNPLGAAAIEYGFSVVVLGKLLVAGLASWAWLWMQSRGGAWERGAVVAVRASCVVLVLVVGWNSLAVLLHT